MPLPHEHSARILPPNRFKSFVRENNKFGEGIDVVFGVDTEGKSHVQSIRFKSDKFTASQAGKWLKEHAKEFRVERFEKARDMGISKREEKREMDEVKETHKATTDGYAIDRAIAFLNRPWD